MAKFKVLANNQIFLSFLGIRFDRSSQETNEFFKSILPYFFLIVSICSVLSAAAFIHSSWPHLEIILQSASIASFGMSQSVGVFFAFGLKMKRVKALNFRLQDIVDEQGD